MKSLISFTSLAFSALLASQLIAADVKPAPNGLEIPANYKDWKVISQSHRVDNNTLRIIIGNDIAVNAARAEQTNPWPQGSILGKLVWKQKNDEHWDKAIVPDKFVHAEFMYKDAQKFSSTGGWGYARWLGLEQKPYGKDKNFSQECYGCHIPVKSKDYVYTTPVSLPK
ncbi:MAG: cytochrome P460 family protein [Pseudomonadota bacterium]